MSSTGLSCPSCKSTLRVPGAAPGRRVRCPKCDTVFAVPAGPSVPAAPKAPVTKDDEFAKIAAADAPVAAVGASKPKPAAGESGDPLPLDDEPKSKPIKGAPRKSAAARDKPSKPAKKRRNDDWDEDDKPKGAINPVFLIGGLAVLAAVMLAAGGGFVVWQLDKKKEQRIEAERVEANLAREREAAARRDQEEAARFRPPLEAARPKPPDRVPGDAPAWPEANPPELPPAPGVPPAADPVPAVPPVEAPARPAFRPVAAVPIKPAPLAQDRTELKLPGTVTDACVGGGGRFWCLLIGDQKQVAIFDVNQAKIAKFLPVASGSAKIAAGMNKLMVAYPDTGVVTRFDLTTFEKELTAQLPVEGTVKTIGMGSASSGPLMVLAAGAGGFGAKGGGAFLDVMTLKKLDLAAPNGGFGNDAMHYRFSPDGRTIGSWCTSHSPSGLKVSSLTEGGLKSKIDEHTTAGFVIPSADGTTVTAIGVYGENGKKMNGPNPNGPCFRMPAVEGKFYLTVPGGGGAQWNTGIDDGSPTTVYAAGENRTLATLKDVTLPTGNEAWANTDFLADRKVLFTTAGQLIAVIDKTGDKLILHKFDLVSALDKSGVDYLLVMSRPPAAEPGKAYKYTPEVKSKKGGVTMKIDAGPAGLKVTGDSLTWNVPKDWTGGDSVIVTISDKSGQEVFHTFTLTAAAPGAKADPEANAGGPLPGAVDPPRPEIAPPPPVVGPKPNPAPTAAGAPKITPTKAADKTELKLPGTADMTCFGGGGRYVLLRIPSAKQVAVLDVCEGKVAKYLPIPEDGAMIAAGNNHLFVLAPTANVIQRWSLTTFEKEVTVANPLKGAARGLLMGHATDGPLFVVGPNRPLDARTFKELDFGKDANGRGMGDMSGHPSYPPTVRVSADGRVFAWHTRGLSPSGLSSMVVGETTKAYYEHTTVGAIIPGPDGTLFTGGGLFTPELKPIGDKQGYQYWYHAPVPAAHGKLYLSIAADDLPGGAGGRKGPRVSLKMVGENKPLVDLGELTGLDVPKDHNQTAARGLQLYDRVFMVPDAKAMAVLHGTADKVTIHKLDLEALLEKAGIDYLFVTSKPPGAACGQVFSYKPEVKSRKGGVKVKLDAGPDGMKVAADGTVTWSVPENFADTSVSVILTVSDSSGQETFHTFTLPVATR